MKLLVLDGNSLVNRAYFGIKLLTTKDGRYTNAIFGFQNILLNLLSAHHPDAVAIAWDEKAPTFRHTAYDGYKATRHGMPQELAEQMPVLKQLLTDLGFVQVSKAGWEADDILGTLAAACEAAGGTTLLATGDRDSLQLVDDATTVLLATNKETIPMDPAAIREKYGIDTAKYDAKIGEMAEYVFLDMTRSIFDHERIERNIRAAYAELPPEKRELYGSVEDQLQYFGIGPTSTTVNPEAHE